MDIGGLQTPQIRPQTPQIHPKMDTGGGGGGDVKPLRFDPQILQIYPKMDMGRGTGHTPQIHPQNPSDLPQNGHRRTPNPTDSA